MASTLNEYLSNTRYEPDVEYVDGILIERGMGTQKHGLLQGVIWAYLWQFRLSHNVVVFVETRLRISQAQGETAIYRIPDVMAVEAPVKPGKAVVQVPSLTVEVLSPDDTFDSVYEKCLEYQALGVSNIVVVDPEKRRLFAFVQGQLNRVEQITVALNNGGAFTFPPPDLFSALDEL